MSYRQDRRDQYHNNGYQQGQFSNSRMQNDGYRPPIRNPYSTPNPNIKGPSYGRKADDDDNASISSSIYSQPSVAGFSPPNNNNMRFYQEQSLETTEPRRQSLIYNEYDYPPSPFAASTNTHNSAGHTAGSSQQGLPLIDKNENKYVTDNMEENYYQDYSQNTQSQFDVYNDFNNNFQDEKYEESRNNTLTGPDNGYDPNLYATNDDNFSVGGKDTRQSATANCVVSKKGRKCVFCSRKNCVIITFTILILMGIGLYFVWPRIPVPAGESGSKFTVTGPNSNIEFQFQLDNTQNWLSYKFDSLDLNIYDATNVVANRPVATGTLKDFTIPGRQISSVISVPIVPSQIVSTVQNFTSTCTFGDLQLIVDITMSIFGLDWIKKPTTSIPLVYLQCPSNTTQSSQEDNQPTSTTPAPTSAEGQPATTSGASTDGTTPGGTDQSGTDQSGTASPASSPVSSPASSPASLPASSPAPTPAPTDTSTDTTAPGGAAPDGNGAATSTDGSAASTDGGATSTDGGATPTSSATDGNGTSSTDGGTSPTDTTGGN